VLLKRFARHLFLFSPGRCTQVRPINFDFSVQPRGSPSFFGTLDPLPSHSRKTAPQTPLFLPLLATVSSQATLLLFSAFSSASFPYRDLAARFIAVPFFQATFSGSFRFPSSFPEWFHRSLDFFFPRTGNNLEDFSPRRWTVSGLLSPFPKSANTALPVSTCFVFFSSLSLRFAVAFYESPHFSPTLPFLVVSHTPSLFSLSLYQCFPHPPTFKHSPKLHLSITL